MNAASPAPLTAGGQDVINSAGTYGDVSRYLQTFPGVVSASDFSNQMLVRGGHPMENLFLVDGIEVPNINHLANANTTGGLGPMIDAAAIQGLGLHTGGYDARFPERLSSVTEFQTLDSNAANHVELDLGIQGAGGLVKRNLNGGDLLVSAHHGLLNVFSKNIGFDGTPTYDNVLVRYTKVSRSSDRLTLLNVLGRDSIKISPCASDTHETNPIDSQYSGWRETTGGDWEHVYSPRSFGVLNVSDSEQVEHINQRNQFINPLNAHYVHGHACPLPKGLLQTTPVYEEDSNQAFTTAKYRHEWANSTVAVSGGSSFWLQRPSFDVNQPEGILSPYLSKMTPVDIASFNAHLSTIETGTFGQVTYHPMKPLYLGAGGRVQTFALGNHLTTTPRLNIAYRLGERAAVRAAYGAYAQLPPYAYLLSYSMNKELLPMKATHEVVGVDLSVGSSRIRAEGYNKQYSDVPASTEFPQVTMQTMVDMLGQQIVWLPMKSASHGRARGIEFSDTSRIGSQWLVQTSFAHSQTKFAGADGVMRPSNFDLPSIFNLATVGHLDHGFVFSTRYAYATGRPYTPFNMKQSLPQNRPIYDLSQVNAVRAPYYSRFDFQVSDDVAISHQHLVLYGGVDNFLNHPNFLAYSWMPLAGSPNNLKRNAVGTLWQMPFFPNFGVRFIVK